MNTMKTHTIHTTTRHALIAAATLALATATSSHAAIVISLQQVGANVVETGSGSANLAGLTFFVPALYGGEINPAASGLAALVGSPANILHDSYIGVAGPSNFGPGGLTFASSGSGSSFGIFFDSSTLSVMVPQGYVSGTALSGSSTFNAATFASLGITPGTYKWTWGAGATADSLTIQAGPAAAVPEPGSALAGMLALGACASGLLRRNRQGAVRA